MRRCNPTDRALVRLARQGMMVVLLVGCGMGADYPDHTDRDDDHEQHRMHFEPSFSEHALLIAQRVQHVAQLQFRRIGRLLIAWYAGTPPPDRVTWAGMAACAGLGLCVLFERLARLRTRRVVPSDFTAGFLDRLHEGKLDCGAALDHCERNPSPAAQVALAAVRRWGRPSADLERAVAMTLRLESERLRHNVGTLRRIAILTPLLGLLGTLFAAGRALDGLATLAPRGLDRAVSTPVVPDRAGLSIASSHPLAAALTPLCAGLVIATLALVAYDGLLSHIENLAGALDRVGAETIDAIALAAPRSSPAIMVSPGPNQGRTRHQSSRRQDRQSQSVDRSDEKRTGP